MTQLIPVIHMRSPRQVLFNVGTCINAGINKIFLINHEVSETALLETASRTKEDFPDLWVGVNLLGVPVEDVITMELVTDGLWCDQTLPLEYILRRRYTGQLFTGVAFKYQKQPENIQEACETAIKTTDVVVTSGEGTGKETPIEKVIKMREYLGKHPLAIASGVNADNISQYKDIVDYILVASSITDEDEFIEQDKLIELKEKL